MNHNLFLASILDSNESADNIFIGNVHKHGSNSERGTPRDIFIKYSPLLDPIAYLSGKYNHHTDMLTRLPTYPPMQESKSSVENDMTASMQDTNNISYIDGLFAYASSKLLHEKGFANGIDCYGMFLGIKQNFKVDVIDELEYLSTTEYFNTQRNIAFEIDDYSSYLDDQVPSMSQLMLEHDDPNLDGDVNIEFSNAPSIHGGEFVFSVESISTDNNNAIGGTQQLPELPPTHITSSIHGDAFCLAGGDAPHNSTCGANGANGANSTESSNCSSRTSHTSNSSENDGNSLSSNHESCSDCSSISTWMTESESETSDGGRENFSSLHSAFDEHCEQKLMATIPSFPVQLICLEKCESTLDSLIMNARISNDEWVAILMQIIMTLLTYQREYAFTHNDLHTNNIMFIFTDEKFLFYEHNNKKYRVPTHGKIFKIIDFGRAIFTLNGRLFCSRDFKEKGDASPQYNTEPYYDPSKKRVDPNYSFDLCRLACSLFDHVIDDVCDDNSTLFAESFIARISNEWCCDDYGKNVLYKHNGKERYLDFKLYKMIARDVHKHTPEAQLIRPEFRQFEI